MSILQTIIDAQREQATFYAPEQAQALVATLNEGADEGDCYEIEPRGRYAVIRCTIEGDFVGFM